jgi:hypothetical protein
VLSCQEWFLDRNSAEDAILMQNTTNSHSTHLHMACISDLSK